MGADVHSEEGAYDTVEDVEVDHNAIFQDRAPGSLALGWCPGINPFANLYDPAPITGVTTTVFVLELR
jgi:hypothetical protein